MPGDTLALRRRRRDTQRPWHLVDARLPGVASPDQFSTNRRLDLARRLRGGRGDFDRDPVRWVIRRSRTSHWSSSAASVRVWYRALKAVHGLSQAGGLLEISGQCAVNGPLPLNRVTAKSRASTRFRGGDDEISVVLARTCQWLHGLDWGKLAAESVPRHPGHCPGWRAIPMVVFQFVRPGGGSTVP